MGCDIHLRVQVLAPKKTEQNKRLDGSFYDWVTEFSDKGWRCMEDMKPNPYWRMEEGDHDRYEAERWFHDRNYDFFAILANVRNGRGFAGVPTGTGFKPIAEPRGYPADLGDLKMLEGDDSMDGIWMGDHSHSWVTLTELLAVEWDTAKTVHTGVVSPAEYVEWKEKGVPSSWCGGVGGTTRVVSNAEMEVLFAKGEVTKEDGGFFSHKREKPVGAFSYYTSVTWMSTYRDSVGENVFHFIDRLKDLCTVWAEGDTDRVRLVFGFDS